MSTNELNSRVVCDRLLEYQLKGIKWSDRMTEKRYLYNVNYTKENRDLCELELRSLFEKEINEKVFIDEQLQAPDQSFFMKNRLEILYVESTFEALVETVKEDGITVEDFLIKYVPLIKYDPLEKEGKRMSKAIGMHFNGFPSFKNPKITYGIMFHNNEWYFGVLEANSCDWMKHQDRPHKYSSSLGISLAKSLINIAGEGDLTKTIIDPCCGIGTVLLEGAYAGYKIKGREINYKVAMGAQANLEHFGYNIEVVNGDIAEEEGYYDVAILDLPYDNFSKSDEAIQHLILSNGKRISKKQIVVSSKNIREELAEAGIFVKEMCEVSKNFKREFSRYIWISE